jgi:general stress protein 26
MATSIQQEQIVKLAELIKGIHVTNLAYFIKNIQIAMLTTRTSENVLHSRPMRVQQVAFDGNLWFFTKSSSQESAEIKHNPRVNVTFAQIDKQLYVSISGKAALIVDRAKMKSLWSPIYKAWLPEGLDDPELQLIKITVDAAEYWDGSASGVATQIFGFVQSLGSGKRSNQEISERVDFSRNANQYTYDLENATVVAAK